MRRHLLLMLTSIFTLLSSVLLAQEPTRTLVLGGLDPVALVAGEELPGEPELERVHGRHRYRFATRENLAAFDADPVRFAVARDGHCGVMPAVHGEPDLFAVHAGRIWLFGTASCRTSFLANPEAYLSRDPLTVAIVVYEGVELLDFTGPGEVFAVAGHGGLFRTLLVSEDGEPVTSLGFATFTPNTSMGHCPTPDVLVVPGGDVGSLATDGARAWIAEAAADAQHVLSVCNGALVLGELGLLDGLSATTHHGALDALERMSDTIGVRRDTRWVDNGRIVTAAGISAGIDGALHVVAKIGGLETARATARHMEVDWEPDEGVDAASTAARRE